MLDAEEKVDRYSVDSDDDGHYYCAFCFPVAEMATLMLCGKTDYSGDPESDEDEEMTCKICIAAKYCPQCGAYLYD